MTDEQYLRAAATPVSDKMAGAPEWRAVDPLDIEAQLLEFRRKVLSLLMLTDSSISLIARASSSST
jgi:hypothetical protein